MGALLSHRSAADARPRPVSSPFGGNGDEQGSVKAQRSDLNIAAISASRAFATATGRQVIVPPPAELTTERIGPLYAALAAMEPSVVIIDEAEGLLGRGMLRTTDAPALRALLAALDGVNRPQSGPVTIALTTLAAELLDEAAVWPGRLAPRLQLAPPRAADRREMLERATAQLPTVGSIDLDVLVERTQTWTGAELAIAVQEACSRSLLDGTDALRMDLLLDVINERYTILDDEPRSAAASWATAIHEAGHAICAELTMPGRLKVVRLTSTGGSTELDEDLVAAPGVSTAQLRLRAEVFAAGRAAERLLLGPDEMTHDDGYDEMSSTRLLERIVALTRGYAPMVLEGSGDRGTGSERMRSGIHAEIEAESRRLFVAAIVRLAPHREAIEAFATRLLDHPEQALAGEELRNALGAALR